MRRAILPIESDCLSKAWAQAFLEALNAPRGELSRLMVTVKIPETGVPSELPAIRQLLDEQLEACEEARIETVAGTIFPESMWNPKMPGRALFERYNNAWKRLQRCPANRNGVYFRRLTAFDEDPVKGNQLQHIIDTWHNGNHRHSALQASILDPRHDHTNCQRRGFPCLQQVSFDAQGSNGEEGLVITGYYAKQHLFEKAYGNYLGLARLGHFMAKALKLRLTEMTCIASVAAYSELPKHKFQSIAEKLREIP
ncbi:MAG: thymidylate synthase [Phycisphaerae bacterium]